MRAFAAATLVAAGVATLVAGTALGQQQSQEEQDLGSRKALMRLFSREAGPLFGMAKGDVPYDAEQAGLRARNLAALAQYAGHDLFLPGTSAEEMPGKSRALGTVWTEGDRFRQGFTDLSDATAIVVAEAGKGQEQLTAAVGKMGQVCGNCHQTFRQQD